MRRSKRIYQNLLSITLESKMRARARLVYASPIYTTHLTAQYCIPKVLFLSWNYSPPPHSYTNQFFWPWDTLVMTARRRQKSYVTLENILRILAKWSPFWVLCGVVWGGIIFLKCANAFPHSIPSIKYFWHYNVQIPVMSHRQAAGKFDWYICRLCFYICIFAVCV